MPYDYEKHRQIGDAIRILREAHDLSQRDVERKLGLSHGYLSNVEKGKKAASKRMIASFETKLGWDVESVRWILEPVDLSPDLPIPIRYIDLSVKVSENGECRSARVSWQCLPPTDEPSSVAIRLIPFRDPKLITVRSQDTSLSFANDSTSDGGFIDVVVSALSAAPDGIDWMGIDVLPPWGVHSVVQQFLNVRFERQLEYPDFPISVWLSIDNTAVDRHDFFLVTGSSDSGFELHRLLVADEPKTLNGVSLDFRLKARAKDAFGIQWNAKGNNFGLGEVDSV